MEKNSIQRKLSVREFFERFPTDETCLERLMDTLADTSLRDLEATGLQ